MVYFIGANKNTRNFAKVNKLMEKLVGKEITFVFINEVTEIDPVVFAQLDKTQDIVIFTLKGN